MKHRIIKKHVNRYITPLIENLTETDHKNEGYVNITLLNGYAHYEGKTIFTRILSMPTHVKIDATVVAISEILANFNDVLLRKKPTKANGCLRMRLLVR